MSVKINSEYVIIAHLDVDEQYKNAAGELKWKNGDLSFDGYNTKTGVTRPHLVLYFSGGEQKIDILDDDAINMYKKLMAPQFIEI